MSVVDLSLREAPLLCFLTYASKIEFIKIQYFEFKDNFLFESKILFRHTKNLKFRVVSNIRICI